MITARFHVSSVEHFAGGNAKINFTPAYQNGKNASWSAATPSGKIELQVTNPTAIEFFEQSMKDHKDLHITFDVVTDD